MNLPTNADSSTYRVVNVHTSAGQTLESAPHPIGGAGQPAAHLHKASCEFASDAAPCLWLNTRLLRVATSQGCVCVVSAVFIHVIPGCRLQPRTRTLEKGSTPHTRAIKFGNSTGRPTSEQPSVGLPGWHRRRVLQPRLAMPGCRTLQGEGTAQFAWMKPLKSDVAARRGCILLVPDLFIHALVCIGTQVEIKHPGKKETCIVLRTF